MLNHGHHIRRPIFPTPTGEVKEIPDGIEPLLAIRGWRVKHKNDTKVVKDDLLYPLSGTHPWESGVNRAVCIYAAARHAAPSESCGCGFWALSDPYNFRQEVVGYNPDVMGVIKMWGKIVIGSQGYRSEYAKIIALYPAAGYLWEHNVHRYGSTSPPLSISLRQRRHLYKKYNVRVSKSVPKAWHSSEPDGWKAPYL